MGGSVSHSAPPPPAQSSTSSMMGGKSSSGEKQGFLGGVPPLAWFACPARGGCGWVTPPSEGSSLARRAVHWPSTVGLVLPGRAQLVGLRPLGDNTTTRGGLPPPGGSWEGDRDPGGHPCQEGRHHWVGALPSGRVASTIDADGKPTPLQEGRGSAGAGEKAASWGSCSLGRQTLLCPPPSREGDGRHRQKGLHDSRYQGRFFCWPPAT